ncbi:MAG: chromate resistance protein [Candidatus Bathyarchaeota archaeon]|nr:chromate resistance protein [Candidatus Bathyarchaeota archaeon]
MVFSPPRAPEAAGLKAAARGFKFMSTDDYDNMARQFPIYDALYMYCQLKVQSKA